MDRLRLLTCIALLGCGAVAAEVQAQVPLAGPCYATEAYPDAAKRPFFAQFLKDARSLTDKSLQLIVDGRIADLYAANRTAIAAANTRFTTQEAFLKEYADMEQREGKVLSFEFRSNGVTISHRGISGDVIFSSAIYAIKTTTQNEGAYLQITTDQGEKGQLVSFIWLEHFPPESPDLLNFGKRKGGVCEQTGSYSPKRVEWKHLT